LQFPPLFVHPAPVFLKDTVQAGEAVADAGEDGFAVASPGWFLAAADHTVHGLAQVAGKLGQPLGEKQRQQEQPE
jgi:dihydrodipicolinate synthase/N-acetylneuraminate lyase